MHVLVEVGDGDDAWARELGLEALDVPAVALGEHVIVAEVLGHPLGELVAELTGEPGRHIAGLGVTEQVVVHAVDDHAAEGHPRRLELAPEVDRLLDRLALGRGDEEEHRPRVGEQLVDLDGTLLEPVDHPADGAEEHGQVLEQVHPGHPLEDPEHHSRAPAHHPGGESGRAEEHLERSSLEELRQPVRRVEEVERVLGRRRVEHEQVVAALLVQLVEALHRHVLGRARDRGRELLVDPVGEDLVARRRVGRQAVDDVVEGALYVQHHRPQLALHLDALGGEQRRVHGVTHVAQLPIVRT